MKKTLLLIIFFSINLLSIDYEQIGLNNGVNDFLSINSFVNYKGMLYFSAAYELYSLEGKNYTLQNLGDYSSYFNIGSVTDLLVDKHNNLIFKNNEGLGVLINGNWQYINKEMYPMIYFNGNYHFFNDTLYMKVGSGTIFTKFYYDEDSQKYKYIDRAIDVVVNNQRISLVSFWDFDKDGNIICASNINNICNFYLLNTKTNQYEFLHKKYNINTNNIESVTNIQYENERIFISTINKDNSVSIYVLEDNLSYYEYKLINNEYINLPAEFNSLIIYKNYALVAAGFSQFYLIDLINHKKTLISKPKQVEELPYNFEWIIRSLYVDENENLFIGTIQDGIFKININEIIENYNSIEKTKQNNSFIYNSLSNEIEFINHLPFKIEIYNLTCQLIYETNKISNNIYLPIENINQALFLKAIYNDSIIFNRIK